jgi:hypothetical protein
MAVFGKLCTPALVYLILGVVSISVAVFYGFGLFSVLAKSLLILIWTWFLNYLCLKNLSGLSWFLVILPYVLFVSLVLFSMDAMEMRKKGLLVPETSMVSVSTIDSAASSPVKMQ